MINNINGLVSLKLGMLNRFFGSLYMLLLGVMWSEGQVCWTCMQEYTDSLSLPSHSHTRYGPHNNSPGREMERELGREGYLQGCQTPYIRYCTYHHHQSTSTHTHAHAHWWHDTVLTANTHEHTYIHTSSHAHRILSHTHILSTHRSHHSSSTLPYWWFWIRQAWNHINRHSSSRQGDHIVSRITMCSSCVLGLNFYSLGVICRLPFLHRNNPYM